MLALTYNFQNLCLCKGWEVWDLFFRGRPLFSEGQAPVPAQDWRGLASAHRRSPLCLGCRVWESDRRAAAVCLSLRQGYQELACTCLWKNCKKLPALNRRIATGTFPSQCGSALRPAGYGPSFATGDCCTSIHSTILCRSPASKPEGDGKMGASLKMTMLWN